MFGPVLGHIGSCLANVGNPLALAEIQLARTVSFWRSGAQVLDGAG